MRGTSRAQRLLLALMLAGTGGTAQAAGFTVPGWGGEDIDAQMNTTLTLGAAVRVEDRAQDLVGKANLHPEVCGRENGHIRWQGCQGLFRTQTFTGDRLASFPGQYTMNADDGNLNYDKGDLTQAPFKATADLKLSRGDWGIFVRGLFFYDLVNNHFTEHHPNRITAQNLDQVGEVSRPGDELLPLPVPVPVLTVRSDSRPCPAERNPGGGPCGLVYGPGAVVNNQRTDKETLREIGTNLQLMDALVYGSVPFIGDRHITVKLGRQLVNWGESTLLFFDSINQANPANANNLFRVGMQTEEIFTPVAMAFLATDLFEGTSLEGFYQLEWQPTIAPAPGSFYSFTDIGSNNAVDYLTLGFGNEPEDPDHVARLLDNSLSGLTNTTLSVKRLPDREPASGGQYGIALKHYADWLNNGTELSFYFMNYHSRLPYVSVYSVAEGCAKHTSNFAQYSLACMDTPLMHALVNGANHPEDATSDAVYFDDIKFLLEYPRNIQMYGFSFNTTLGDVSLQGEVAYRPKQPLQVDAEDLAFAAYGPAATNCHLPETGCSGSGRGDLAGALPVDLPLDVLQQLGVPLSGIGLKPDGSTGTYPNSDYVVDANGTPGTFHDTYDLIIGHMMGAGRAFPSFIIPYRGQTLGTNPPHSYIRGWETFKTFQFNLGGTYLMGATETLPSLIGADQVILLFESGATWVPDLPPLDMLQLEAPGTFLHASAGADGSGSDGSRQACSANVACSYGPDGERFNPHQEDLSYFPDKLSFGYDVVAIVLYESVLPGISLRPYLLWKHDVHGTAPGVASNFVEGRMMGDALLEIRYKDQLSFNVGYNFQGGGGKANLLRDRDTVRAFIKYQF